MIKRIGQYFIGTCDKGIRISPKLEEINNIQCYVDADFAENYTNDTNTNLDSVKSR